MPASADLGGCVIASFVLSAWDYQAIHGADRG
jgi:hypothetical protein